MKRRGSPGIQGLHHIMPPDVNSPGKNEGPILTVSELNRRASELLRTKLRNIWIRGEISDVFRPGSGHWYFTLMDKAAQVRCVMFKEHNRGLDFRIEHGMQITAYCQVGLYEVRGTFQLIVQSIEPGGDGALRLAFEQLRARLEKQGLFSPDRKSPLPAMPLRIGVLTSTSSAALQDILTVLNRRCPMAEVIVFPAEVQGPNAPTSLCAALDALQEFNTMHSEQRVEVAIMGRGGGPMEDLQAFNDKNLALAAASCEIPLVSAVGHETDFTILDYVADKRAATPSAAAELVSADQQALCDEFLSIRRGMETAIARRRAEAQRDFKATKRLLRHPRQRLQEHRQKLADLFQRSQNALVGKLKLARQTYGDLSGRLSRQSAAKRLEQSQLHSAALHRNLCRNMRTRIGIARRDLAMAQISLQDPRQVLGAVRARMEALESRARRAMQDRLTDRKEALQDPMGRLLRRNPRSAIEQQRLHCTFLRSGLHGGVQQTLTRCRQALRLKFGKLDALSPLRMLDLGYAAVRREDNLSVTSIQDVHTGSRLNIFLADGRIGCEVRETDSGARLLSSTFERQAKQ